MPTVLPLQKNTPFPLRKHADLGGKVPEKGAIPPDSLRANLLVLARSAHCFAQCFPYPRLIP